jgi:hypothetical protein
MRSRCESARFATPAGARLTLALGNSLALEYGLKAVYHASFHELFEENRENDEFAALLQRMRVVNAEGESELTEEQWEAASEFSSALQIRRATR